MTNNSPKTDDSEIARRRKAQILDAAAECFRRKGFHRSSLAQISAAAGMSPGHVYHYFKSKEDIIAAIVARERSESDLLIREARAAGSLSGVVDVFVAQLAAGVVRHRDRSRASLTMEILAEAARNPAIASVVQHDNAEFHQALLALFQDQSPATRSKMEILGALMEGLSVRAIRNPDADEDLDLDMLRHVVRVILAS